MRLKEAFKQLIMLKMKNENNDLLMLRECLVDFKNRGMDRASMYGSLEEMRVGVDEKTESVILELMDIVMGFCNPVSQIFSPETTDRDG